MQLIINNKFIVFIMLLIFLALIIVPNNLNKIKSYGYRLLRTAYKTHIEYTTNNFAEVNNEKFKIKYKDMSTDSVQLVAETANEIVKPVNNFFNFNFNETVPVIIYPTMEDLNESFGWDGDKSPMGVYWMGTIRVLAPEIWINEEDAEEQARVFKAMGPMAHEYAHLVVDYKTDGNYTRWFTEGVAQYVEKQLTGFTLDEPSDEAKLNLYPFAKLDREFDEQRDQDLAYWQSLMAIEYLVDKHGRQVINALLDQLAQGKDLNTAFTIVVGEDLNTFENSIKMYAKNSLIN